MLNKAYQLNNNFIIKLNGHFDADTVQKMKDQIEIYSTFSSNIVFDLEQVNFIDSSGIGAIVFLYKRMATKGFSVYVTGLAQQPLELFQILFLDKTIHCFPNVETYLESTSNLKIAS